MSDSPDHEFAHSFETLEETTDDLTDPMTDLTEQVSELAVRMGEVADGLSRFDGSDTAVGTVKQHSLADD